MNVKEKHSEKTADVNMEPSLDKINSGDIGKIKKEKLKPYKSLIFAEVAKRRK